MMIQFYSFMLLIFKIMLMLNPFNPWVPFPISIQSGTFSQITMKRNIVLNFVRARTSTCYAPSLQLQVTVLEADTARTG